MDSPDQSAVKRPGTNSGDGIIPEQAEREAGRGSAAQRIQEIRQQALPQRGTHAEERCSRPVWRAQRGPAQRARKGETERDAWGAQAPCRGSPSRSPLRPSSTDGRAYRPAARRCRVSPLHDSRSKLPPRWSRDGSPPTPGSVARARRGGSVWRVVRAVVTLYRYLTRVGGFCVFEQRFQPPAIRVGHAVPLCCFIQHCDRWAVNYRSFEGWVIIVLFAAPEATVPARSMSNFPV